MNHTGQLMKEQILGKIRSRTAEVAIIGLGYVGLPLAVAFTEGGIEVDEVDPLGSVPLPRERSLAR